MNTLNSIIVEDEKNGREALQSLLGMFCPQVRLLASAGDVASAKSLIQKHQPDLVFLDIRLGQENGFDLLEALAPVSFQIIFTTSLDSFALQAFKANAVDYLLKPIEPDALVKAVEKAQILKGGESQMQARLTELIRSLQSPQIERISIPSQNDGITILEVGNILYVHGNGPYSTFHTKDEQKITACHNLGHYASILPEPSFYRTHQSYLINVNFISKILPGQGLVELTDGAMIPLARSRRDRLLEQFKLH